VTAGVLTDDVVTEAADRDGLTVVNGAGVLSAPRWGVVGPVDGPFWVGEAVVAAGVVALVDPARAVGVDPLGTIAAEWCSVGVMPVPVVAFDGDVEAGAAAVVVAVPVPELLPDGISGPELLLELVAPLEVPVVLVPLGGVVVPTVLAETVDVDDPEVVAEEPALVVAVVLPALEPVELVELAGFDELEELVLLLLPVDVPAPTVCGAACAIADPLASAAPTPRVAAPARNQVEVSVWRWRACRRTFCRCAVALARFAVRSFPAMAGPLRLATNFRPKRLGTCCRPFNTDGEAKLNWEILTSLRRAAQQLTPRFLMGIGVLIIARCFDG
jgi:hypothetical protein